MYIYIRTYTHTNYQNFLIEYIYMFINLFIIKIIAYIIISLNFLNKKLTFLFITLSNDYFIFSIFYENITFLSFNFTSYFKTIFHFKLLQIS